MKPLVRRKFYIVGVSPLLMHNPEGTMVLDTGGPKVKKILAAAEEAEAGAYRIEGKNSQLWGPAIGFRDGIITACKGRRLGKVSAGTVLAGAVFVMAGHEKCLLYHPKTKKAITTYEVDTRRAVIPTSGAAVLRSRPLIREWATDVVLEIDDESGSVELVLEFLQGAGRKAGWLDYRPERGGGYGRYEAKLAEE